MKRKITLSIALVLSIVLVSLMKSDSKVSAEPPSRFSADTGVVSLRAGQTLRILVAGTLGRGSHVVQFRRLEYMQTACSGGICQSAVSAQTASAPMILGQFESISLDIIGTDATGTLSVRGIVSSDSRDVHVNALIVDTATGEVQGYINLPMDDIIVTS